MKSLRLPVAIAALTLASSAMAGLVGTTVDGAGSATGITTFSFGPTSATVGGGMEFAGCVGPNDDGCVRSGMFVGVDIADSSITFAFSGGVFFATGDFTIALSGFDEVISAVALTSSTPLLEGTFGLQGFTADSITFTGVPSIGYSGSGGIYVFDLTTSAVPEPTSAALAGLALLGLGLARRRKA